MFLDYHMSSAPLSINSLGEHNAEDGSERNESSGSHRNLDRALELEVANVVAGEEGREVVLIGGRRRGRLEEEEVAALRGTRRGEGPGANQELAVSMRHTRREDSDQGGDGARVQVEIRRR